MTMLEASERYHIPVDILEEYENLGQCNAVKKAAGARQYDDQDIERLSMIMTLHEIGFGSEEVETYMRLTSGGKDTQAQRMAMLNKKRGKMLDEIHFREKQIEHMDYLRYNLGRDQ